MLYVIFKMVNGKRLQLRILFYLAGILVLTVLIPTVIACGGKPATLAEMQQHGDSGPGMHGGDEGFSYDKSGNLVDKEGNLVIEKSKIKIPEELARRIMEKYLVETYNNYELRGNFLEFEHGRIVHQMDTVIDGKSTALHVDAVTGDIYGIGCMQGPQTNVILKYYNPEEFKTSSAALTGNVVKQKSKSDNLMSTGLLLIGGILVTGSIALFAFYLKLSDTKLSKTQRIANKEKVE